MVHGWCVFLLTLGVCGLSSSVPRQFHVVKKEKNWTEAQQYCREEFTDLATIDNMSDIDEIKRVMQDASVGERWRGWIGLKYGGSPKWQWSLADEGFHGENEVEFRNWDTDAGQPTGMAGLDCGCIHQGGKWHDCYCSSGELPFICYNGPNSTHPYVLVSTLKNWTDAQRYCREKHTDLASVRNQAEENKIRHLLNSVTTGLMWFWIGLFRDAWEWSDGSSSSFSHWGSGEPNNDRSKDRCVEMESVSGQWNDRSCGTSTAFICYEDLPTATVVVSTPSPPFYSGDVVTLSCDITNYTDWHRYRWLKDNSPVPGKTSQTIIITLPEDAGQYQCSGERNNRPMASSVSSSVDIFSNDLPTATVVVSTPSPPFYSGDVVTLSCDITNYTDWHRYRWLKDNSPVPGKTSQTIIITPPEDAGQYQCSGERNNRPMASSVSSSVDIFSNAHVKRTQMVSVEMQASDDMNMEDPAVQKAFLQQIEDRLKAKGFRGDVKLSWRVQPDGKVFHKKKNDKKKEKRNEL